MRILLYTICLFLIACSREETPTKVFELKSNELTGIDFENNITSTNEFNVYKYRNFYNGGGVALGDVNNDGLIDVYLVANQDSNKLFLNKGDFKFEDITAKAGVAGTKAWSTGVTFADVNGDGFLDIYVCNSGDLTGDDKESELFINQGNLTFSEQATEYGLNDKGYSTHASFFDYDKDGDLDVYLLNNSYAAIGSFNLRKNQRPLRDQLGGDKLLRNDNGKFVDVSEEAGIYGSQIGFGLGITVSDFNNDNWLDMFISNDFFERDYLYMNQGDGTFKEDLVNQISSISAASMGADAADINNDGFTDLFVTDMLPYEYERLKTVTTFDDWNRYSYNLKNDYHHQFTRNVLQLNQSGEYFTEISRLMNVDASDWSWGALFFDMDNDGFKDLFIANGIYKDLTNQDYLEYIANESIIQSIVSDQGVNYKELIDIIPSNKVRNMAFRNVGGKDFKLDENLGLNDLSFSNGSAFGDLDNDGDLDLVVNNVNMSSFVYENSSGNGENFIRLVLKGEGKNPFGIGARVKATVDDKVMTFENIHCKGFQSTVDHRMTIGIGQAESINLEVQWPSNKKTIINNVTPGQELLIEESKSSTVNESSGIANEDKVFKERSTLDYVHKESPFSDFNQERLIFWMRNNEGGKMSLGDIDSDGIKDILLPGAKGNNTAMLKGTADGLFELNKSWSISEELRTEWTDAELQDFDSDGDTDLFLAAGGVENSKFSPALIDQLFLNDGSGGYAKSDPGALPVDKRSTSSIVSLDFDNDGDLDVLCTERIKVAQCGKPCSTQLLQNDGSGNFKDVTESIATDLIDIGMVTSSSVSDIDQDGDQDIIIAGEFMELSILENNDGKFKKIELNTDTELSGLWNHITTTDIDGDGDMDIIAGNSGLNSRFSASSESQMQLVYGDFDKNGFEEGILCMKREDGKFYPYSLRHDLIDQMKKLKKKFPDFESFKKASIVDIIGKENYDTALKLEVNNLKTTLLINEGSWTFKSVKLPDEVQFTSIYAIAAHDFDQDGDMDIVMGGNLYSVLPEAGIYDASRGLYLENTGELSFEPRLNELDIRGEIRDFLVHGNYLLVNVSNDSLKMLRF